MNYVALALTGVIALNATGARAGDAPSLYDRLGGTPGLTRIADQLIERVAADPRAARSFEGTNLKRIEKNLTQQLCELTGGPCHYDGDSMHRVHAGQHINEREFYVLVETLEDILRKERVAIADRNHLLALLAPMKRDIVQVPADGQ